MRILVVNPYGRDGAYSGPNMLMERLFSKVGETNDVVVLGGIGAAPREGYRWATRTIALSENGSLGGLRQVVWSVRAVAWLLVHARQFDVVHVHGAYLFNLLPALAARARRVPYVVIALAAEGDLSANSRLMRIPVVGPLRRRIVANSAAGYALAEDIRAEFARLGLSPERIHSLGNSVDVDLFRSLIGLEDDRRARSRALVFVGKVGRRKRATVVLEAIAKLRARGHRALGVFVGPFEDETFEQEFRSQSRDLGLEGSIVVTGHVTDVHSYLLSDVSLFVLPSAQEGLPGALVEAMASGLPCGVTNVGSMGEVVRAADAGLVIEPNAVSISDFAEKAWADEDQWRAWSGRARHYAVRHYSTQRVAEQYLEPFNAFDRSTGQRSTGAMHSDGARTTRGAEPPAPPA